MCYTPRVGVAAVTGPGGGHAAIGWLVEHRQLTGVLVGSIRFCVHQHFGIRCPVNYVMRRVHRPFDSSACDFDVLRIKLNPDEAPPLHHAADASATAAHERVEYRAAGGRLGDAC